MLHDFIVNNFDLLIKSEDSVAWKKFQKYEGRDGCYQRDVKKQQAEQVQ